MPSIQAIGGRMRRSPRPSCRDPQRTPASRRDRQHPGLLRRPPSPAVRPLRPGWSARRVRSPRAASCGQVRSRSFSTRSTAAPSDRRHGQRRCAWPSHRRCIPDNTRAATARSAPGCHAERSSSTSTVPRRFPRLGSSPAPGRQAPARSPGRTEARSGTCPARRESSPTPARSGVSRSHAPRITGQVHDRGGFTGLSDPNPPRSWKSRPAGTVWPAVADLRKCPRCRSAGSRSASRARS